MDPNKSFEKDAHYATLHSHLSSYRYAEISMCELLLILSNRNVGINLSWRALQDRANYNPHGWGAAWKHRDGSYKFKKQPEKLPGGDVMKGSSLRLTLLIF